MMTNIYIFILCSITMQKLMMGFLIAAAIAIAISVRGTVYNSTSVLYMYFWKIMNDAAKYL